MNLVWLVLTLDKKGSLGCNLEKGLKYLDLANKHVQVLNNGLKLKLLNNYSVYYYYKGEYKLAIDYLEESLNYCDERYLPEVYNNLAELSFTYNKDSIHINNYLEKAEIYGTEQDNIVSLGKTFFTKAKVELHEGQIFRALDYLYLAFTHFKNCETQSYALDCLIKINEIISTHKMDCLKSIKSRLGNGLE